MAELEEISEKKHNGPRPLLRPLLRLPSYGPFLRPPLAPPLSYGPLLRPRNSFCLFSSFSSLLVLCSLFPATPPFCWRAWLAGGRVAWHGALADS